MKLVAKPRPACLVHEDRALTLYIPQPHTAVQLAEISRNFERSLEALGSDYEYTGVTIGDTLQRNAAIGLPNCSSLVASLDWRDGGPELPFTYDHVKSISEQLNVEYPIPGTARARVVYDSPTGLKAGVIVTIAASDDYPQFIMMPNHGRLPYSTVFGIKDVELYPSTERDEAHFVFPDAPRYNQDIHKISQLTAQVAEQLEIFLTETPGWTDLKPSGDN